MGEAKHRRGMCGVFLLLVSAAAAAQETEGEKKPPPLEHAGQAIVGEVGRYLADSLALAGAPFHWDKGDAYTAIGAGAVVGGLIAADPHIYREIQNVRSDFTDRVSAATTVFGAAGGWGTAGGLLVVGILANQQDIRDMGRDSLETLVLTNVLTNVFIKPTFGRWRPNQSDGTNRFEPFSGHNSFTSGHSTIAWSVASVVAMRAPGWIIPTIAYGLATVVAFDRVNDQQHFMGDVVGGAFFATAIGRFLVRRHLAERKSPVAEKEPAISIEVVPIHDGAALRLLF
jgi:membrane-associated phospholipid phosphatase